MELLDRLTLDDAWSEYLAFKTEQATMPKDELKELTEFVQEKKYRPVVERILSTYELSTPVLNEVNKIGTTKKRKVFVFTREENFVLKMLSYLLRDYDCLFDDNLYSFRANRGVKKGIRSIMRTTNMSDTYTYKVDIHNYFNSVETEPMLDLIREKMPEEKKFLRLFENVLRDPYVMIDGVKSEAQKGIMAGMPVSGFFANLYLAEMDHYFWENKISYIRYSDDVIVFGKTEEEIKEYEKIINDTLYRKGLEINEKKVIRTKPGEKIEFLGFEFLRHDINLAEISVQKMKGKLHRRARSIYRWRIRKGVPGEKAVKAYTKFLNRKFYDNHVRGEITWARWYFPLITQDTRLKEIDDYALSCIRYINTGRYSKKNFNLRYKRIKELGFRGLVNSYWKFRNGTYDKDELAGRKETAKAPVAEAAPAAKS